VAAVATHTPVAATSTGGCHRLILPCFKGCRSRSGYWREEQFELENFFYITTKKQIPGSLLKKKNNIETITTTKK